MAIFDDVRRVIEDTIRVDMKKRWTPQVVKFISNKNEFYGTFNGKVNADGGTITNIGLSNVTIYDTDGVSVSLNDILEIEDRVEDLEFQLVDLSNIVRKEVPEWIYSKVSEVSVDLKTDINTLDGKLGQEIANRQLADS